MNRIIAAFDGLKFSASTKGYAVTLAQQTSAHLVGVFLEDPTHHSYKIYDLITEEESDPEAKRLRLEEQDLQKRNSAVEAFETACRNAGLSYTIHRDRDVAIQDLLKESIYADLLVIGSNELGSPYEEHAPAQFIRELLADVQCPVLVTPPVCTPVERIVLLYDGAPSSVFAIRMMRYALPLPGPVSVEVVTVNNDYEAIASPAKRMMHEYMQCHYPDANFISLTGDPEKTIVHYLQNRTDHPLVVLGAYRRGRVSRWFRSSMADLLIKETSLPLFIAHYR